MESLEKPVTENEIMPGAGHDPNARHLGSCPRPEKTQEHAPRLSPSLDCVLDEIRAGAENALYGAGPGESDKLFTERVASLIEGAGLPVLQTMHYRWFLRELAKLWRTRTGRDLAFHLELCIRKWVGLGLEPKTLQFLICESYERLKGKDNSEVRNQNAEVRSDDERTTMNEGTSVTATGGDMTELSDNSDRVPSPDSATAKDAKNAKGGDMTGLSDNTDRVPSPTRREPQTSTTKAPSHEEAGPEAPSCHSELVEESRPGDTPPSASGRHSVSSASSAVDLSSSDTGTLESSTPRTLPDDPLLSSQPMSGPRPPADPVTGTLEPSTPRILPDDSSNPGGQQ